MAASFSSMALSITRTRFSSCAVAVHATDAIERLLDFRQPQRLKGRPVLADARRENAVEHGGQLLRGRDAAVCVEMQLYVRQPGYEAVIDLHDWSSVEAAGHERARPPT